MTNATYTRRGVEALIDLVVSILILYAVAAATGNTTDVGFGFNLYGWPFVIGLALCFAYFVFLEALLGATLGKFLTGLRVVDEKGEPITWGQSAIRNAFRVVDGLVLYIIGFITMCLTEKRQRLGDLVAGSVVVRRVVQPATKP
jgi:uncharacterized RDD family membrane protein YckC